MTTHTHHRYGPIAYYALVTAAALAPDPDTRQVHRTAMCIVVYLVTRQLATIATYLQLYDWLLAAHKGVISSPRGRGRVLSVDIHAFI